MPANPLQDNGRPRYDWFKRIVQDVIGAAQNDQLKWNENGVPVQWPGWLKKAIRREIVRTAKAFVGHVKWNGQDEDYVNNLEKQVRILREENRELRAENSALNSVAEYAHERANGDADD